MSEMAEALVSISEKVVNEALVLSPLTRDAIARETYLWLERKARKLPSPNMTDRLSRMKEKIDKMAEELIVMINGDEIILDATSVESATTIQHLVRGSEWFEPHPNFFKLVFNEVTAKGM